MSFASAAIPRDRQPTSQPPSRRVPLAAGVILITALAVGCQSHPYYDGYYSDYRDDGSYARPAAYHDDTSWSTSTWSHHDDDSRHSHRDRDRDRHRDRVPRGADVVKEGKGQLEYSADKQGKVYVYDRELDKVVYKGRLDSGDEFTVDPKNNRVLVGGDTESDSDGKKDKD